MLEAAPSPKALAARQSSSACGSPSLFVPGRSRAGFSPVPLWAGLRVFSRASCSCSAVQSSLLASTSEAPPRREPGKRILTALFNTPQAWFGSAAQSGSEQRADVPTANARRQAGSCAQRCPRRGRAPRVRDARSSKALVNASFCASERGAADKSAATCQFNAFSPAPSASARCGSPGAAG